MALFESKLVATMLLQRFSFSLKPGEKENITYSFMVTMSICNSGPCKYSTTVGFAATDFIGFQL